MDKDIYIVYKITNKLNNKEYIGFHKCKNGNIDDGYMGSGKLIKAAIEKYGKDNFKKEILKKFDNKEDAEKYERELVDVEYTLREDTYNLSIGGNVLILCGENNGFYGKKHKKETIEKIQKKRSKTISERGYTRLYKLAFYIDDELLPTKQKIREYLSLKNYKTSDRAIIKFIIENNLRLYNEDLRSKLEKIYYNILRHEQYMKEIKALKCSQRFSDVPKSEEHRKKIGLAHKGTTKPWVSEVINKDPEKIRKTAEKHRGMKRSEETKKNISSAIKEYYDNGGENPLKGKNVYYNEETKEIKYFSEDEEIPKGWVKGNIKTKRKCFYDPETLECKRFKPGEEPDGWIQGNPAAKRKFFYNPETLECKRFKPGEEPDGWIQGNPKLK